MIYWGCPAGSLVKNLPANAEATGDVGSILGSGRSPGGGHDSPLQYSCLENFIERGDWQVSPWGHKELDMTKSRLWFFQ